MNLHAFKIFTAVASCGSVTAAAEKLNLTQPAVTMQLRKLEQELDTALVEGRGRGIQLTEAGAYLYEHGDSLFKHEQMIEQKFHTFLAGQQTIKVAASYISTNYVLPHVMAMYQKQYPTTKFELSLGNVQSVKERILRHEVDFGYVVQQQVKDDELRFEHVRDLDFIFIVHPSHPLANQKVSLEAICAEPFVYREKRSSTRTLLESVFAANNKKLPPAFVEIQGVEESIRVVEAGLGMTLAPLISIEERLAQQKLARVLIDCPAIQQSLYICTRNEDVAEHPFNTCLKQMMEGE